MVGRNPKCVVHRCRDHVGYQRIVTKLRQWLGNVYLTPVRAASAELVASVLIGISGFTGWHNDLVGAGLRYGHVVADCHRLTGQLFREKAACVNGDTG